MEIKPHVELTTKLCLRVNVLLLALVGCSQSIDRHRQIDNAHSAHKYGFITGMKVIFYNYSHRCETELLSDNSYHNVFSLNLHSYIMLLISLLSV